MATSSSMGLAMQLAPSRSCSEPVDPSFSSSQSRRWRWNSIILAKIRENFFMPALSSTMTEGKNEGDKVSKGESIVVVESDKADMDVETFNWILVSTAETEEEVEEAKAKYASDAAPAPAPSAPVSPPPPPPPAPAPIPAATTLAAASSSHASQGGSRLVAPPYAKKLKLAEDLHTVSASGPFWSTVVADIEKDAAGPAENGAPAPAAPAAMPAAMMASAAASAVLSPSTQAAPLDGDVQFTVMQAAVARITVESLEVPVSRVGYTITTDALHALHETIKSKDVSFTVLLVKATALALVKHPVMNSRCKNGNSVVYNSNINIAVAVDGGLITPVLQDADKVDIYSLSRKWKELRDKARAKQLQPPEYSTGAFTISNLGMYGVDRSDAILPPGTGAIMSVGASKRTMVASHDGSFGTRRQMQVNVTADHRVIYQANVAAFLQTLAKIIEEPTELTL